MMLVDLVLLLAVSATVEAQDAGPQVSKEVHEALAKCLNGVPARVGLIKYKKLPDISTLHFSAKYAEGAEEDCLFIGVNYYERDDANWESWHEIKRCYERFNVFKNFSLSREASIRITDGGSDDSGLIYRHSGLRSDFLDIANVGSDPAHWSLTFEADWSAVGGEEARLRNQRSRFPNGLDDEEFEDAKNRGTTSSVASQTPTCVTAETSSTPRVQSTVSVSQSWDDVELHSQEGRWFNPIDEWLAGRLGAVAAAAAAVRQRGLSTHL